VSRPESGSSSRRNADHDTQTAVSGIRSFPDDTPPPGFCEVIVEPAFPGDDASADVFDMEIDNDGNLYVSRRTLGIAKYDDGRWIRVHEYPVLDISFDSAGEHSVVFDGSSPASGVYFHRFESESFRKSGKIILVK